MSAKKACWLLTILVPVQTLMVCQFIKEKTGLNAGYETVSFLGSRLVFRPTKQINIPNKPKVIVTKFNPTRNDVRK